MFSHSMTAYFIIDRILVPGILLFTAIRGIASLYAPSSQWPLLLGSVLGTVVVLLILLRSQRPKSVRIGWRSSIGILLSFAAPCFLRFHAAPQDLATAFLTTSASLFYFAFAIASYLTIGRSLGVVSAQKDLVVAGPYSVVRHPIYAAFILATLTLLLAFWSALNAAAFAALSLGLFLRIQDEEDLLAADPAYRDYSVRVPSRALTIPLIIPILPLLAIRLYGHLPMRPAPQRHLVVQTAFPILSLDPLKYDDWASVFVGNHIYPRLFPETDREWIPSVAQDAKFKCLDQDRLLLHPCRKERLILKFREFTTCQGNILRRSEIKDEMLKILRAKSWIIPRFHVCLEPEADLCLEYAGIRDITKRLQNVYFRFGASSQDFSKNTVGVAPYCFQIKQRTPDAILTGTLIHLQAPALPSMEIITSDDMNSDFNIALFGGPQLLKGSRENIDLITPLAYYVVSNPRLSPRRLPWNTRDVAAVIRSHLERYDLIHEKDNLITRWMPRGDALSEFPLPKMTDGTSVELALPDYLPDCLGLAKKLNRAGSGIAPICTNTSALIIERAHGYDKHSKPWYGFLTPLSPGAPGRTSVFDQYFSPDSSETWLAGAKTPSDHFYRVGIGKSPVTVDKNIICNIRGNPMGYSDLVASDFIYCE